MAFGSVHVVARADLAQFEREMKAGGQRAGNLAGEELLKSLRTELQQKVGTAKEALTRGLIDRRDFRRISQDAAKEFNAGITKELDRMRAAGQRNTDEFGRLQRALRSVGTAGRAAGQEARKAGEDVQKGFLERVSGLPAIVRGSLAAGLVGAFTFVAGQIVGVFRNMVSSIRSILERGGASQSIRESFGALASSRGLVGIDAIANLRTATRGLVTDLDLIKQANVALQSGLPVTEESLARLAEVARRLARATGRDATEAFERLVGGIQKGSINILEELGITTRLSDAMREWEKQTGRTSTALSQQERQLIFMNAVMAEAEAKVTALGTETLSAGERIQQASTFVSNLGDAFAEAIASSPRIVDFLGAIGSTAEESAKKIDDLADRFGAFIDTLLGSPIVRGLEFEVKIGGKAAQFGLGKLLGIDSDTFDVNLERRRIERELARRRQQEAALRSRATAPPGAAGGEEDEAERKRIAAQRLAVEEQLAQQLAKLTRDATAESIRAVEKLEAAYVAAFGRIDREARDKFAALRQAIGAEALALDLEAALDTARTAEVATAADAGALITSLRQLEESARRLAEVQTEGSVAQQRFLDVAARASAEIERLASAADAAAAGGAKRLADEIAEIARATPETAEEVGELASEIRGILQTAEREAAAFADGTQAREAYNRVVEQAIELLRRFAGVAEQAGEAQKKADEDAAKAAEERIRQLRDNARTLEENARAAVQFAEALGLIDGEAAKALQSLVQVGTAVARIAGGDLTAIPSLLGGVASLFSGGGRDERDRQFRQAAAEAARLAEELAELGKVVGPLVSAVRQAGNALEAVAERLNLTGVSDRDSAIRERSRLRQLRADVATDDRHDIGDHRERTLRKLDEKIRVLDQALEAYDKAVANTAEQLKQDLELRKLAAEGHDEELARRRLEIDQANELRDAQEAFGGFPDILAEVIPQLQEVHELERQAAERRLVEARRDEEVQLEARRLRALGFAESAAAIEREREREKELAAARVDATRAALEAIHAEEDLARQRDIARELEDLQLQAFGTDRERQEFAAQTQMNDAIQRYTDLLNAGVIDQDQFAAAMEAIAAIFQRSIDEIQAAADQLRLSFLDDLAILQAENAGDADAIARIRFQAAQRDRRAEAQRLLDQGVITQADFDALIAALEAAADKFEQGGDSVAAAANAGRLERGPDTVVRDLRGATEVTMVTAADLLRSSLQVERQQLSRLVSIEELLRRDGGAAAYIPPPPGASTATTNVSQTRSVSLGAINVQVASVSSGNARQVGREIGQGIRDELEQIDAGLGRRQSFARGNAGRLER